MLHVFQLLLDAAQGVDLADPAAARTKLVERFDPTGVAAAHLRAELVQLLEAGRIADRGALPVRWSRAAKASAASLNFSIDVVLMNGAGPHHRHPAGEVNFCLALEGEPLFDGHAPGWVVFPPNSDHVPTVTGGTMLIVYLLPAGAIEFTAQA